MSYRIWLLATILLSSLSQADLYSGETVDLNALEAQQDRETSEDAISKGIIEALAECSAAYNEQICARAFTNVTNQNLASGGQGWGATNSSSTEEKGMDPMMLMMMMGGMGGGEGGGQDNMLGMIMMMMGNKDGKSGGGGNELGMLLPMLMGGGGI